MAINTQLNTHDWISLPPQVRAKLVKIFNIPRSGVGHVDYTSSGPVQSSDGHTHEDLKAISVEAMQRYLVSTETDFSKLFEGVLTWAGTDVVRDIETGVQKTQEQTLQEWIDKVKEIRLEAEEKGLIREFIMTLKNEIKVKK